MLAGCGGSGGSGKSQPLDPAVAARLADESDAVADAIQANDGCEAARRVAALRASVQRASVPDRIRRELERYASRTFTCVPTSTPPPPPPPPPPSPPPVVSTQDDEDNHGENEGKGHGKGKKKPKKHGHGDDD